MRVRKREIKRVRKREIKRVRERIWFVLMVNSTALSSFDIEE